MPEVIPEQTEVNNEIHSQKWYHLESKNNNETSTNML